MEAVGKEGEGNGSLNGGNGKGESEIIGSETEKGISMETVPTEGFECLQDKQEEDEVYRATIKISPSDVEVGSDSDDDFVDEDNDDEEKDKSGVFPTRVASRSSSNNEEEDIKVFGDIDDNCGNNDENCEEFRQIALRTLRNRTRTVQVVKAKKNKSKRKCTKRQKIYSDSESSHSTEEKFVKVPRKRGRKPDPRRLDGKEDSTTEEEDEEEVPVRFGTGYHVLYKRKVLKYARTHSNGATAEKFGIKPKLVREWRKLKEKIEMDCETPPKKRPRSDGYTVEEKLEAIAFAAERSLDEARLLYNVDKRTIEKWKAKKNRLEARLSEGQGNSIREAGSGSKPKFTHIEDKLRDWIVGLRLKGITVNPRMILDKAKNLIEADGKGEEIRAPRSSTWVVGFLKRHNLSSLLGTTLGHEDPSEIITFQLLNGNGDVTELANNINEIPVNPNKRHRRRISMEDKLNIIRRIEQGETQMTVAKSLQVPTSTVQTIWSCRKDILLKSQKKRIYSKSTSISMFWRKYSVLASALQDWYEQSVSNNISITAQNLLDKAIQISETYKLIGFAEEAKEWLKLFCKRKELKDILAELNVIRPLPSSITTPTVEIPIAELIDPPSPSSPISTTVNPLESCSTNNDNKAFPDNNEFLNTSYNVPVKQDPSHCLLHSTTVSSGNQRHNILFQNTLFDSSTVLQHGSCNSVNNPSAVSLTEAIDCIDRLRSWISMNYGQKEVQLNNHLAAIENAVLKKRAT